MADIEMQNMDDLEDGEIESDSEQQTEESVTPPAAAEAPLEPATLHGEPKNKSNNQPGRKSSKAEKREKKKAKEQQNKADRSFQKKDKSRKFLLPTPVEDDYAGNIEKAIRLALKKGADLPGDYPLDAERFDSGVDDLDSKRKHKKRKKHDQPDKESSKKKKKREDRGKGDEEMDDDEMMCVRGASPVFKQGPPEEEPYDNTYQSEEEYDSEGSGGSRGRERGARGGRGRGGGGRDRRTDRSRMRAIHRRQDIHPQQDPDGVCLFFMQGKCYKGDECTFSHDAQPPRKLELCKFYLMDCCAKRDKCLYLHSDFPCKYYHTGLTCIYKDDCKFAHGKPLSDSLKNILLKHIESAPKEILGDFPRLNRESAAKMVAITQNTLIQQFSPTKSNAKEKLNPIPSIFELNVLKPHSYEENQMINPNEHSHHNEHFQHNDKSKNMSKVRQSRWCDSPPPVPSMGAPPTATPIPATSGILNIHNLNGVLTQHQISELVNLGIDNLNQLSQLTVNQLNQLGLTMRQIHEIQLNTMSIQKLGLIQNQSSNSNAFLNNAKMSKDLDMRVSPILPDLKPNPITPEVVGQDVDMRFQQNSLLPNLMGDTDCRTIERDTFPADPRKQKNSIDIDQYTKDALKFSKFEKEDTSTENDFTNENRSNILKVESKKDVDIDHRLHQYMQDATLASVRLSQEENEEMKAESDTDIRISSLPAKPQDFYKPEHKARRTTTDDEEEDNLQIDEKWYSSDEDRNDKIFSKIKSPPEANQPKVYTPSLAPESIEPSTVITKLGDLSKIDISAEVSKLLTSIKNNTPAEQISEPPKVDIPQKLRDPRNMKKSPERKTSTESIKKVIQESKAPKPGFVSIYNCVEGGSSDGRKRTDIDLRPIKDIDFRMPSFGDTDLRQTPGSGDVDLRLGLPFKPIPNYTPATEIDGSINTHPPITFKLSIVDVPRPDYTDIKNSTPKSQAALDPRLRKIFRLSIDESSLESVEKAPKPAAVRIDPRKRAQEPVVEKATAAKPAPLDLQAIIQTSNWYRELSSNQKILVNQQLASVSMAVKKFHQDNTSGRLFDLSEIRSNNVLTNIFTNLSITLNEKGEFTPIMLENNPPVIPPMNFNQNENFVGGNIGLMDPVGMMGMNPMGAPNMNPMGPPNMGPMGPMGNFDMRFQGGDPRGAPGLLGRAPNVPHNFDSGNFNGMPNFNNDNTSRMPNFNNDNNSRMPNYNNDNNPRMQNFNNDNFNSNFNDNNPGMYNKNAGGNEFRGDNNYDDKYYNRNQKGDGRNDFKPYRGGRGGERWRGSRGRERRGGYSERGGGSGGTYSERGGGGGWKGDRR